MFWNRLSFPWIQPHDCAFYDAVRSAGGDVSRAPFPRQGDGVRAPGTSNPIHMRMPLNHRDIVCVEDAGLPIRHQHMKYETM